MAQKRKTDPKGAKAPKGAKTSAKREVTEDIYKEDGYESGLKGGGLLYPTIKVSVQAGGFEVKLPDGGTQNVRAVEGIILFDHPNYRFFKNEYDGSEGTPPDCISLNGEYGTARPDGEGPPDGQACKSCPFTFKREYLSMPRAQRPRTCSQGHAAWMHVHSFDPDVPVTEEGVYFIQIPTTSIGEFRGHMGVSAGRAAQEFGLRRPDPRLMVARLHSEGGVTKVTKQKVTKLVWSWVAAATKTQALAAKEYVDRKAEIAGALGPAPTQKQLTAGGDEGWG